jgi:GNAT superfamily N-acetyltransferase
MSDQAFLARIRLEPLGPKHDRAAFSCGDERLDNFIKISASRQQEQDIAQTNVGCLDQDFVVISYYALNSHFIDVTTLPSDDRKRLPNYETIPAIYLSKLGVHTEHQGKGLGSRLMAHAFAQCLRVANIVGAHFLILDALNEDAARLYRRLGFHDLPGHEPRMLIKISVIRKAALS